MVALASTESCISHVSCRKYRADLSLYFERLVRKVEDVVKVIDRLRTLPSSAVVFNDVRLKATRYIRFNGIALISAQIDHVVLTPAGVFVIETKRWSHRFVESGDFYNPGYSMPGRSLRRSAPAPRKDRDTASGRRSTAMTVPSRFLC
jgi:hypothetical protein